MNKFKRFLKGCGTACFGISFVCIVLFALYMLVYFVYNETGPHRFNQDTIAYQITTDEVRTLVTVKQVYREKGKEDIYLIDFANALHDEVEIPASIYMQYIGDDNNTITLTKTTLSIAVAAVEFGTSFNEARLYQVYRYNLPWENDDIEFTQANAICFMEMLRDDKYNFQFRELPFNFEYSAKGWAHSNVLDRGYTCWSSQQ